MRTVGLNSVDDESTGEELVIYKFIIFIFYQTSYMGEMINSYKILIGIPESISYSKYRGEGGKIIIKYI
jgi:hypothetical protein